MSAAVMTSKGQLTIPKDVRDRLKLKAGDRIEFSQDEFGVVTLHPKNGDIRALRGIVPKPRQAATLEDMERAIIRGANGELDI